MAQTIVECFHERIRSHPDKVALRKKLNGSWVDITWQDYGETVRRAGKSLLAMGFGHGDKNSLLSGNRPEWHFVDVTNMSLGGATAAVYQT
ncbi:MAG: long-chain acyl-CoA synthetase, partial [Actinomycetota bacterium]|nr:long-chain acyl-CoA synthetase [Actinomycetota bacterium]